MSEFYKDKSRVAVVYTECGKCIELASHPDLLLPYNKDGKETRKYFAKAHEKGQKVGSISYEEFQESGLYCKCSTKNL